MFFRWNDEGNIILNRSNKKDAQNGQMILFNRVVKIYMN